MATLSRNQVTDVLANMASLGQNEIRVDGKGTMLPIDPALEPQYDTDKDAVKIVPCRECKRPMVVTTFFAPAKAHCRECKGEVAAAGQRVATVGQPIPGETHPSKAVNLVDALINKQFAHARCPVHPDDEDHVMELISVVHNDNYGPTIFMGYDKGQPVYKQTAPGETVRHQCQHGDCKATVDYSTVAQQRYQRINEVRQQPDLGRRPGFTLELLNGTRRIEDAAA